MAQQTINVGTAPNDGTGTPLRTAFQYTNSNFSELYTAVGPSGNNIVVPGSATITGDLTVATDRLKVNTGSTAVQIGSTTQTQIGTTAWPTDLISKASSRVLIGNLGTSIFWNESSPAIGNASTLYIGAKTGAGATTFGGGYISAGTENASDRAGFFALSTFQSNGIDRERYRIDSTGVHTWQYVGGVAGTAMTLNSTGLGVGGSPSSRLDVANSGTPVVFSMTLTGAQRWQQIIDTSVGNWTLRDQTGSKDVLIATAGTGNIGIGVTPSAWASNRRALQVGGLAAAALALNGTSNVSEMFFNSFVNTSASNVYAVNGRAGLIDFGSGGFGFSIDSGTQTAGAACNFTRAMTLNADGRLFVGTTAIGPWNTRLTLSTDSGTTKWSVGPWDSGGDTNFAVAATNSAGGVFLSGTAATSWTAISDERLKDIIEPITNAVTKIGSLRTVIGKFKNDENNTRKAFLIAQDVQAVLPEAVDASNPDRLGLAYTEVIPLLVAAIKELTAEVNALKNA